MTALRLPTAPCGTVASRPRNFSASVSVSRTKLWIMLPCSLQEPHSGYHILNAHTIALADKDGRMSVGSRRDDIILIVVYERHLRHPRASFGSAAASLCPRHQPGREQAHGRREMERA